MMDLLSSLTSKALQGTDTATPSSDLRPRLGSQFEPTDTPITLEQIEAADDGMETSSRTSDRIPGATILNRQSANMADQPIGKGQLPAENESLLRPVPTPTIGSPTAMPPLKEIEAQPMDAVRSSSRRDEPVLQPTVVRPIDAREPRTLGMYEADMTEARPLFTPQHTDIKFGPHQPPDRRQMHELIDSPRLQMVPDQAQNASTYEADVLRTPKVIAERIDVSHTELRSLASDRLPALVPSVKPVIAASQTTRPETEPMMPTIHVTIGRVEIKAVTPNPPSRNRTAVSSTMSLDEYLRRRKGSDR